MLMLYRPWDTQPQDESNIDWGNSLVAGLTTLINGKNPSVNLAGQSLLSGALESFAKPSGMAVTGSTTSGFISNTTIISGDRTIAFLCRPATATPGTKVMFTSTTGAGVAYWVGTESGTNNWSIGGLVDAPSNTVLANTDQFIVATKLGTTHSLYINGVLVASGTNAMADGATGSTWLRFGSGVGNTWTSAVGVLHLGACWNTRALSSVEVNLLAKNPWQLFEPQRLFIPINVAGAGAYTLNLESGSYTITGSDATFLHNYLHNLGPGTYTVSGADATLLKNSLLNLESGSYTINGSDLSFELARVMDLNPGSYAISGSDVTFVRSYQLNMAAGAYNISGQDITFTYSGTSNSVTIKAGSWLRYRTIQ